MKKVLLLLSFLVAFFVSNAQYPVIQWIGRDSALVDSRGGFKARLINYPFTDTTQANTQRISQYAGALIYTTSGGDKLWLRNSTATAWDRIGTSSGGGGGIVSLGASAYGLIIQNDSTYKADTIQLSTRLWRQKGIDSVQGNVTSGLALKLNLSDTASMLTNYVRRQELKDTAAAIRSAIGGGGSGSVTSVGSGYGLSGGPITTTGTLSVDSATLSNHYLRRKDSLTASNLLGYVTRQVLADSMAAIATSYILNEVTTGYDSLSYVEADTLKLKGLRVVAGSNATVTPTITGTTISYSISGNDTTSLSNRINLKIDSLRRSGVNVQALKNGSWTDQFTDSVGGGSGYPSVPTIDDPNRWTVVNDPRNPIFSVANMGGSNPLETSMYAPSPLSINDTLFRVYAKGDATNSIHYWESRDSMRTWQYVDTAMYPTPSPTWDSVDVTFPFAAYDNANDSIHLYYTGGRGYYANYGLGHVAFKPNAAHPITRPASPILTNAQLKALSGLDSVSFVNMSSMVKQDGKWYFYGSICKTDSCYIYQARGTDWNNIDSMWIIQRPNAAMGYDGIIGPSVYKRSGTWYATFADSRLDGIRVDTSKSWLASMYSTDNRTWTRLPGYFMQPRGDTSWNGKQIYDLQWLKVNGGNYDSLYKLPKDTAWAGMTKDQTDNIVYGFVSGSYFGCCEDQSGIVYALPQENDKMNFGVTKHNYRKDISFFDRNNTLMLNVPDASINTRGALTPADWRTFRYKADSSGQWSYIHNRSTSQTDANFNIAGNGRVQRFNAGGNFPSGSDYTIVAESYQNSGNALDLKNASYFGIRKYTQITSEVTEIMQGTGHGYLQTLTGTNGINYRAYKYRFQPVFSPFTPLITLFGKSDNDTTIEMNSTRGVSYPHTDAGITLSVLHTDYYNTTSAALNSYGVESYNTAVRSSGSNNLTNYAGRFKSSGGQVNYSLSLGNAAMYEANYGSSFTDRSLVDKGYVDSVNAANLTEGTYTPTLTNTTNVAASTAYTTYYIRVGDWVHVWGTVDIDATAATTITEMDMTLPIATTLSNVYALSGTASFEDNTSVQIKANTSNGKAMWRFTPQSATNNTYSFHFSYKYTAP